MNQHSFTDDEIQSFRLLSFDYADFYEYAIFTLDDVVQNVLMYQYDY